VHLIINNVTRDPEVDRVDDFVISILLITIKIWCLTAVA
jgi:hypothetical protein